MGPVPLSRYRFLLLFYSTFPGIILLAGVVVVTLYPGLPRCVTYILCVAEWRAIS